MNFLLLGGFVNGLLGFLMAFLSLFLIMLILIQRGKGGGLTGALGGPGGQSAFGSKAGDTFTVVTVVVASIWGFTCAFAMWLNVDSGDSGFDDQTVAAQGAGVDGGLPDAEAGADTGTGTDTDPGAVPALSQGSELTGPSIGGAAETTDPEEKPAETTEPEEAPVEPAKPAEPPAETTKPEEAPVETAAPAEAPAETTTPAETGTEKTKPADAPAETNSGESADKN